MENGVLSLNNFNKANAADIKYSANVV